MYIFKTRLAYSKHAANHGVAQTRVSLVAHIGEGAAPPFIKDPSTNGFVTIRYVEESQFTSDGPDWMNFVMKRLIPRRSTILDIYGHSGM